jgi:hypothetical protein
MRPLLFAGFSVQYTAVICWMWNKWRIFCRHGNTASYCSWSSIVIYWLFFERHFRKTTHFVYRVSVSLFLLFVGLFSSVYVLFSSFNYNLFVIHLFLHLLYYTCPDLYVLCLTIITIFVPSSILSCFLAYYTHLFILIFCSSPCFSYFFLFVRCNDLDLYDSVRICAPCSVTRGTREIFPLGWPVTRIRFERSISRMQNSHWTDELLLSIEKEPTKMRKKQTYRFSATASVGNLLVNNSGFERF